MGTWVGVPKRRKLQVIRFVLHKRRKNKTKHWTLEERERQESTRETSLSVAKSEELRGWLVKL